MANYDYTIPQGAEGALSANKVLKNTYPIFGSHSRTWLSYQYVTVSAARSWALHLRNRA